MKFDKILATSQSRTKAPTEDTVIEESRIIKDNAEIPLTDIDFYSDNNVAQPFNIDEEELNRLTESIKSMGQLTPATVRELDSGKYELLSGHKRYIALQKLEKKLSFAVFVILMTKKHSRLFVTLTYSAKVRSLQRYAICSMDTDSVSVRICR